MSLRLQLLTLGALTLLLPWAGLEMVRLVEDALREGLEDSLLDTTRAETVSGLLAENDALRGRPPRTEQSAEPLYLHLLTRQPEIDGFLGDWFFTRDASDSAAASRVQTLGNGSRLSLGLYSGFVYLYVEVTDDEIVYQVPGQEPHGDRIAVAYVTSTGVTGAVLLANSAPGSFRAQPTRGAPGFAPSGGYEDRISGEWRSTEDGYAIEAALPFSVVAGGLGIGVIDSDDGGASAELATSTWSETGEPNEIVREIAELNRILRQFANDNDRIRIFDADGWVLADTGPLAMPLAVEADQNPSLVEQFFRYVLRPQDPEYSMLEIRPGRIGDSRLGRALEGQDATAWYTRGAGVSGILAIAVPIDREDPNLGAVLVEQAVASIQTVTNETMMRLMATMFLIIVATAAGLFAYASFLSFRVGRLARAAESALGPRGEIDTKLPGTRGRDEIGDLSRSFADLLGRLRDYTEYLQSLKSKLSHELRTPLAIVATSIDNLEHELKTGQGREYLERLRHGTERLESILQAMTAATRVEQAIAESELEQFDLVTVIASCVSAYDDVYAGRAFVATLPDEPVVIEGSAELVEQLLDKLVDNAVSFAVADSKIEVLVEPSPDRVRLSVINRGPPLPATMRHQLFDSLVTVRQSRTEKPHLGLGLYIVMLVAEFHGGKAEAENLADRTGVRIGVVLPRRDAGAT